MVAAMSRVARYGKMVAHEGSGQKLAEILLAAADGLADDPGCELYLVSHQAGEPDVVWVTELWRSQADLDASIERIRGSADVAAAMALVKTPQMVELELLGGKGPSPAAADQDSTR
jgi:quinol monooxygenase YgiN